MVGLSTSRCSAAPLRSSNLLSSLLTRLLTVLQEEIGVPQIAPFFGVGMGNVIFDGPGEDQDFGLEQISGNAADRYGFRSAPLRNVSLQPAFFHNGAFTRLEDAIYHHLHVFESARNSRLRGPAWSPALSAARGRSPRISRT